MLNLKLILFLSIFMAITSLFFLKANVASPQDQPKIEASLQIHSGIPNPTWTINDLNEINRLKEFINGLPKTSPVESPQFGSFILLSNNIPEFPQVIEVYNGVIKVINADKTKDYLQDSKGLREFLISKAIEQGIKVPGAMRGDLDGDGIPDKQDECPDSNGDVTIKVGSCNSGVRNKLLTGGCTITDKIASCAKGASNHGQFVSCVAHLTNDLQSNRVISGNDKGKIQSCAAQAKIP